MPSKTVEVRGANVPTGLQAIRNALLVLLHNRHDVAAFTEAVHDIIFFPKGKSLREDNQRDLGEVAISINIAAAVEVDHDPDFAADLQKHFPSKKS